MLNIVILINEDYYVMIMYEINICIYILMVYTIKKTSK